SQSSQSSFSAKADRVKKIKPIDKILFISKVHLINYLVRFFIYNMLTLVNLAHNSLNFNNLVQKKGLFAKSSLNIP
ncbi:MAG: hypothetical protein MJB14_08920, partial [Spirochaetes bacterium]|nr:hypothetical protein [Spirochaetota bacterium]